MSYVHDDKITRPRRVHRDGAYPGVASHAHQNVLLLPLPAYRTETVYCDNWCNYHRNVIFINNLYTKMLLNVLLIINTFICSILNSQF